MSVHWTFGDGETACGVSDHEVSAADVVAETHDDLREQLHRHRFCRKCETALSEFLREMTSEIHQLLSIARGARS